jgi:tetratricopeptide (TPR) repeat protein
MAALLAVAILAGAPLRSALGPFDAGVATVAAGLVALAALPLDRACITGPAGSRVLVIASVLACALATLGAASRVRASEDVQAGWDHAFGARLIASDRRLATERARDAYDRATAGNPADFFGEIARADFLSRAGLLAEAEVSARRALRIHPWLINARVELADLRRSQGDDDGAMHEAVAARALNPDAVEPHLLAGDLFLRQGRDRLAAEEFERAVEVSPKRVQPKAKVRAAEIYLAAGEDLPRALKNLEEAEREAGDDPEVLARIAAVYSGPGAPPELQAKAGKLWNRVHALNPADPRARLQIAVAPMLSSDATRQDLEQIVGALDALIRSDPEFDPARVRYFRGLALERLGRRDEAEQAFREVTLLTSIAPFRSRADDKELDEAIKAMQALQASRAESRR